jgi:hypothetical protein
MNGELFKVRSATNYRPLRDTCVSLTFEDEDFDVSIIVVATEGEDRYSNTKKDLPALQKKTHSCGETYLHSKSLCTNYSYAASIHKAQGKYYKPCIYHRRRHQKLINYYQRKASIYKCRYIKGFLQIISIRYTR